MTAKVLAFALLVILLAFAGSALAWMYKYDCNVLPTELPEWGLRTGDAQWMQIEADPDSPGNNVLHIMSPDRPDPWGGALVNTENSQRPQTRLQTIPFVEGGEAWTGDTDIGSTFEIRFKQTAGGIFMEPYDGTYKISFETTLGGAGLPGEDPYRYCIAFLDAGPVYGSGGQYGESWVGPDIDYSNWVVFRGTLQHLGGGNLGVYAYIDGETWFNADDLTKSTSIGTNTFRWGHSGGSGPAEGSFSDIWVDYLYLDNGGAFPPGVPTTGETAVSGTTWGSIKCQF
jgi:hypothetical protein